MQTPLHLAAITKQPHTIEMLLKAKADPTLRDRHGNTAAHVACSHGDVASLKVLVNREIRRERGALPELNIQNYNGNCRFLDRSSHFTPAMRTNYGMFSSVWKAHLPGNLLNSVQNKFLNENLLRIGSRHSSVGLKLVVYVCFIEVLCAFILFAFFFRSLLLFFLLTVSTVF